ncbi:hypothetical protein [Rubinisphaera sp. JC750]|uniref:hypothetical protein n=1 Tax=Rubinisphaera sp. JC750 TaxID=2898658 RepID=UPI001F1A14F4|nr:hypothetical protein [Rubinisphaera sp. JC750]
METSELIIRWIARVVVAIYLIRLASDLAGWPAEGMVRRQRERTVRWLWTAGFVLHVLHVLLAFHWIHHWDHNHAYTHTAERTAAVVNWYWGGGLYINYVFTALWGAEVVWSWKRGLDRLKPAYVIGLHSLVLFLMFNATVVFGPWWWKYAAVPITLILWQLGRRSTQRPTWSKETA